MHHQPKYFTMNFYMHSKPHDKNFIAQKIEKQIPLTKEEEYFYLTEILGLPSENARIMLLKPINVGPGLYKRASNEE